MFFSLKNKTFKVENGMLYQVTSTGYKHISQPRGKIKRRAERCGFINKHNHLNSQPSERQRESGKYSKRRRRY